jgi:hypothetical protein
MAHKTAEVTDSYNREVTSLFEHAYRTFGDSLKVAMKAQEDTVKFWSGMVGKMNPAQAMAVDWIPVAQKNADEYLRLLETSYRRNADLLKKVIKAQNGEDLEGAEKNSRELWDASFQVANANVQDMAATQMRVAQAWTEVLKNATPSKAVAGK